jgi:phosphoribosylformylglycinamidine cyclo-ligase
LYEDLLTGLAEACAAQGITLLGGETAELPGMYGEEFDLVGCVTGVVNRGELLTGEAVRPGHTIIGLASTGLHTNGYSLARRVLFEEAGLTVNDQPADLGESLGRALLRPHRCYWPAIRRAREVGVALDGIAHITGGGWYDNVPRIMSDDVAAVFEDNDLPVPPIFHLIQDRGGVEPTEMYRVFNMGMGMAWFVPPEHETSALACCREVGIPAAVVGRATARSAGLPAVTIAWVE